MDLHRIADEIASLADDFLAGTANRTEARAGVAELIHSEHPELSALDKAAVADAVMKILEDEDFFSGNGLGDTYGEGDGADAADDIERDA